MAYGKLYSDRWAHVGPKKQYNDILKTSKKNCSIGFANWEKIVADHTAWCSQVSTGTANMEQKNKRGMQHSTETWHAKCVVSIWQSVKICLSTVKHGFGLALACSATSKSILSLTDDSMVVFGMMDKQNKDLACYLVICGFIKDVAGL